MNKFFEHIDEEYGVFGLICVVLTFVMVLLLWLFLSILLILPAFAPVAFVAWWAYKYYKARS